MPVIDALILISARVEKLRKYDEPPPGRIGSVMRIIADGRMATLLEVEQVIEWLEEKRVKLGGRKRTYQSDESTQRLKDTITQLFGKGGSSKPAAPQVPKPAKIAGAKVFDTSIAQKAPPRVQTYDQPPPANYGGPNNGGYHGNQGGYDFDPLPEGPPTRGPGGPPPVSHHGAPPSRGPPPPHGGYNQYSQPPPQMNNRYQEYGQPPPAGYGGPPPQPGQGYQEGYDGYSGGYQGPSPAGGEEPSYSNDYHPSGVTYGQSNRQSHF